jgi:hypothetical protein
MRALPNSHAYATQWASCEIHNPSMGAGEKAQLLAIQKQESLPEEEVDEK